jgi:hypothetical protein
MKDFIGQDLMVGDTVAFSNLSYRNLEKGVIDSFTPKKIRIKYTDNRWGIKHENSFYLADPCIVVRIAKANIEAAIIDAAKNL